MSSGRKSLIPTTSTDYSDCLRFLNWLSTIGVEIHQGPGVHEAAILLNELGDGTKLLRVLDIVVPGSVDWTKVELETKSNSFKVLANCNYLLEKLRNLGVQCHLITANQIQQKNIKSLLSLLWIMMREYFRRRLNIVSDEEFNLEADKFIPSVEVDIQTNFDDDGEMICAVNPEESPEFEPLRQVFFYGLEGEVFGAYHDEASEIDCEHLPEDFSYLNRVPLKTGENYSQHLDQAILHLKTRWKTLNGKRSKAHSYVHMEPVFETPNLPDKPGKTIEDQVRLKTSTPLLPPVSTSSPIQLRTTLPSSSETSLAQPYPSAPDHPTALPAWQHPQAPKHPTNHNTAAATIRTTSSNNTTHARPSLLCSPDSPSLPLPQVSHVPRTDRAHRPGVLSARRGYFLAQPVVGAESAAGGLSRINSPLAEDNKRLFYSPSGVSVEREGKLRSHRSRTHKSSAKGTDKANEYASNQDKIERKQDDYNQNFLSVPGDHLFTAAFECLPTSRFGEERPVFTEITNHVVPLVDRRSRVDYGKPIAQYGSNFAKENANNTNLGLTDGLFRSRSRQKSVTNQKGTKYSIQSNSDILVGIGINGPTLLELLLESKSAQSEHPVEGSKSLKVELLKRHHFTRFRIGKDTKPSVPFFLKIIQNLNKEGFLRAIKSNRYFVHSRVLLNNVHELTISEIARPNFNPETKNLNQSAFSLTIDAGYKSQMANNTSQTGGYVSIFTARMALEKIAHGLPQESQSRRTILELLTSLENLLAPNSVIIKTGSCTPMGGSPSSGNLYLPQAEALPTVFNILKHNRLLTISQRLLVRRAEYIIERARNQVSAQSGSWTPQIPIIPASVYSPPQLVITPVDISPN